MEHLTIYFALVGLLSLGCQWLGWYLKLPAILLLLLAGFMIKPVLNYLIPMGVADEVLFPFISMAVAIILFEGALTLTLDQIRGHGRMVTNLISIGMLITWVIISSACHLIMETNWMVSTLFGALVVVTGPTVIMPFIRAIQPSTKLSNILLWEGILIDPVGALFAVLIYEFVMTNHDTLHTVIVYGYMLCIGLGLGSFAGWVVGVALRRHIFPPYLINVAVMVLMLAVYVLSNSIIEESGLLTVTVMGVVLANMDDVDVSGILEFKETLSVLLISGLFILLAARVDIDQFILLGWPVVALLAVILFVARPISIWVSSLGTKDLSRNDLLFLSWISPRGIVAAAVSTLFAIKLESQNIEGAELLVPLVFSVIITTVVLQSLTANRVAKILGVKSRKYRRILIFGAGAFPRQFASILKEHGMEVVLADPNWMNTSQARMDGLDVYFGNPTTEEAKIQIDLNNVGRVFICSPYRQLNLLVAYYFENILDTKEIYHLSSLEHKKEKDKEKDKELFGGVSYNELASLVKSGATIKVTKLSEEFTYENLKEKASEQIIPLALFKNNAFQMLHDLNESDIEQGDGLMYLLESKTEDKK
tara:strand:- start:576 stop:2351 length:1776 start_codon:yes stop_codon:yes gene_type:complete